MTLLQDAGTPLDLQELFFRFTLDSISEIAYGVSIGSLHDPSVPFLRAFDDAQATIGVRGGERGERSGTVLV